jgi:hypothetical protein
MASIRERKVHYTVHRRHTRKKGIKRKLFQLTDAQTCDVLAGAEFASAISSVIQVSNSRGLVCEIDVKSAKGPFIMRLGMDPVLSMSIGDRGAIVLEFKDMDGDPPLYPPLVSPPKSCADLAAAFGSRRAIRSVKNCRFCLDGNEIVAVRKVHKNALEIDAKFNVSFLACFVIGISLFLAKQ